MKKLVSPGHKQEISKQWPAHIDHWQYEKSSKTSYPQNTQNARKEMIGLVHNLIILNSSREKKNWLRKGVTEKRRLKRKPAKKLGNTISFKTKIVTRQLSTHMGHGHYENNNISTHEHRHQPRNPILSHSIVASNLSSSTLHIFSSHAWKEVEVLIMN